MASSVFPGNDALTVDVLLKEMLKRDNGYSRSWGSACSDSGMGNLIKTEECVSAGQNCDQFDDHMICADEVLQNIQVGVQPDHVP